MGMAKGRQYKLAVLAPHPIQYQAPLFRDLATHPEIDLHVYFCSRWGLNSYRDPGFGLSFSWDTPLLEGYNYTFLRNLSPRPGPGRFSGCMNPGILRMILQGGYDALWVNGWAQANTWLAWTGAALRGVPILLRGETNGLGEPNGLKGAIKRVVVRAFFSRISGFLAVGSNNANFYSSYGVPAERIFLTPYAVDNAFFVKEARQLEGQKRTLREKSGIPSDRPVILFCGKFQEKKRPLDVLQAFARLNSRLQASLVFVGDGPLRPTMEHFIAEHGLSNVCMLGFHNQKEMPIYYALADVLVLPSIFEPWGLVVNEAMCFGLPVIASDKSGAAADLVKSGINGFTYSAGDEQALANALMMVLENEEGRRSMGHASYDIISHWGFEEDVGGILQALEHVTNLKK